MNYLIPAAFHRVPYRAINPQLPQVLWKSCKLQVTESVAIASTTMLFCGPFVDV